MIYEMPVSAAARLRPIVATLADPLGPLAALEGNGPGRFWADSPDAPHAVLFWDEAYEISLAGGADDEAFRAALRGLLVETVFPAARAAGRDGYLLRYAPAAWESEFPAPLPGSKPLVAYLRRIYTFAGTQLAQSARVPEGVALRRVDLALLAAEQVGNKGSLLEWVMDCWGSRERFGERGAAWCLLQEQEVVSWCGLEYVSTGRCGFGVETDARFRGRGYAKCVAAACVEECLRRGLVAHWDCWDANVASWKVAEALGFRRSADYPVYWGQY
jgi:hypothetical protein